MKKMNRENGVDVYVNDLDMIVISEKKSGDQLRFYLQDDSLFIDTNTTSNLGMEADRNKLLEEADWALCLPKKDFVQSIDKVISLIERNSGKNGC